MSGHSPALNVGKVPCGFCGIHCALFSLQPPVLALPRVVSTFFFSIRSDNLTDERHTT